MAIGEDLGEEGDITGLEIPPAERGVQITLWGPQPWDPTLGRQVLLAGLQSSGT